MLEYLDIPKVAHECTSILQFGTSYELCGLVGMTNNTKSCGFLARSRTCRKRTSVEGIEGEDHVEEAKSTREKSSGNTRILHSVERDEFSVGISVPLDGIRVPGEEYIPDDEYQTRNLMNKPARPGEEYSPDEEDPASAG